MSPESAWSPSAQGYFPWPLLRPKIGGTEVTQVSAQQANVEVLFQDPPERVWPLVSDTSLLNQLNGLPPLRYRSEMGADGLPRRLGTLRQMGFDLDFEELPYTWEHGRFWLMKRRYSGGPLREVDIRLVLMPEESGGCRVSLNCIVRPPSPLMAPVASLILNQAMVPGFRKALERWSSRLAARIEPALLALEERREPADEATRARIAEYVARLQASHPSPLAARLEEAVALESPTTLHKMRPYQYARLWGAPRQQVVDLFLAAAHVGLLSMRWDVLCPHCRGAQESHASLSAVREQSSCQACSVHFEVDLSRTLEVVFAPHPAVRPTEPLAYCAGGPGTLPHIVLQHVLEPGERREVVLALPPGRYRVRTHGSQELRYLDVSGEEGEQRGRLSISESGLAAGDLRLGGRGGVRLRLENESSRTRLLVVERAEWLQEALVAGELVASPRFSELYSSQALAPGVRLAIERVVVLFTDLVGSTALYRQLGDARAFQFVWGHFDALRQVLEKENGLLVKTIGDAIMAVFLDPRAALRAAAALHEAMAQHGQRTGLPVGLRVGLASGPAFAVNLNGRLDYFGTTVNLAARVQGCSQGGDILAPTELVAEAGGPALLGAKGWEGQPLSINAKGFEAPIPCLRFLSAGPAPSSAQAQAASSSPGPSPR